jgi:hypothetical protein
MHRFIVAWAITAIALLSPNLAKASDQETAKQIASSLKQSGRLVGFSIGVKYHEGTAWLKGRVSSEEQRALAVEMAEQMPDVSEVVDELTVEAAAPKNVPALRAAYSGREDQTAGRLAPQQPVVYAAKAPRAIAAATVRMSEPTVDPNVQMTAGELEFPGSALEAGAPQLASAEPTVQSVSTKRSILRRRNVNSQPSPQAVRSTFEPAGEVTTINGQQVRLIAMTRAPNGSLVPADPALAARFAQSGQQMQLAPQTKAVLPSQTAAPAVRSQAITYRTVPAALSQTPKTHGRRGRPMPIATRGQGGQAMQTAYNAGGQFPVGPVPAMDGVPGAPLPANVPAPMAGPAPAYYDQPNMPNYAWPSYAAYPNYAAVTYPKQYSPTAWPYIGPFYPYPQVPLGWRKVTLEWDDGWWFLDFDDKNCQ